MRKVMKVCLILGISFVVIGGGITTAAAAMGATLDYGWRDEIMDWGHLEEKTVHRRNTRSGDSWDGTYANVRELSVDVRAGMLYLMDGGDSGGIRVVCENGNKGLTVYQDGDELEVTWDQATWGNYNFEEEKLYIYVPSDYSFDSVDIYLGAGAVSAETLRARELELEAKAGAIEIVKGNTDKLDLNCMAGGIKYSGAVNREIDAECSTGGIELKLTDKKTDYNYELKCNLGSIMLGGEKYSSLSGEKRINNHASKQMDLECRTGGINVAFDHTF